MLHSLHGINAVRLNGINGTLQRMQDDPEALQRAMARFDEPPPDEPPPPYSSYTSTQPATPTFRVQLTAEETDELVRRPLNNEELFRFRRGLRAYRPAHQFDVEAKKERERINDVSSNRDSMGRLVYRGPNIFRRAGSQRLDIMVRNSIRKRWEALGFWNPEWGIPIMGLRFGDNRHPDEWSWNWRTRPVRGKYQTKPFAEQVASWPPRDEEHVDERAIRRYFENKGQWIETQAPSNPDTAITMEEEVDQNEARITTRPWYQWAIEVLEEAIKLSRTDDTGYADREAAAVKIREQWKAKGDWKDSWGDSPGWRWKHESPSPEPEDPNEMDFSPSEIDALEAIQPPTPPTFNGALWIPKFGPPSEGPIFDFLGQSDPNGLALTQPSEGHQGNGETESNENGAVEDGRDTNPPQVSNNSASLASRQSETSSTAMGDQRVPRKATRFMVDKSLSPTQAAVPTATSTRTLRKRKRDERSNSHTGESSLPHLSIHTETRQMKRRRTTPSASELPQQAARNPAPNDAIMHKQLQTPPARGQPPIGPRRSARIAQLQEEKQKSSQSTKAEISRDRIDKASPTAITRNNRMSSKQPNTIGTVDSQLTRKGRKGAKTRTRGGHWLRSS